MESDLNIDGIFGTKLTRLLESIYISIKRKVWFYQIVRLILLMLVPYHKFSTFFDIFTVLKLIETVSYKSKFNIFFLQKVPNLYMYHLEKWIIIAQIYVILMCLTQDMSYLVHYACFGIKSKICSGSCRSHSV